MNTNAKTAFAAKINIVDDEKGIVDYTASDQTLDSHGEVVMVNGWNFTKFQKNSPFVNSHQYGSISDILGRVVSAEVKDGALVARVQWAKDIAGSMAELGWKLTKAGMLKAVSVGFQPLKMVTRWDRDLQPYRDALKRIGRTEDDNINAVYLEQELLELSAVVLGANPNAVARAYKSGILSDGDLETIEKMTARHETFLRNQKQDTDDAAARALTRAAPKRSRSALMLGINATASRLRIN